MQNEAIQSKIQAFMVETKLISKAIELLLKFSLRKLESSQIGIKTMQALGIDINDLTVPDWFKQISNSF